jgi:hypothetical protein
MGQLQPVSPEDNGAIAKRSESAQRAEPRGERAISQLVAWSLVCALQKYILTYADFQRLRSGALALWRPTGK